jgi:(p)ppGpp synthase/HD superfamily hydrolase
MTMIKDAPDFARQAHEGQTRKGARRDPYISHVEEVAGLVARFGGGPEVEAAAWLHDTVEDCGVSNLEIARRFGPVVAEIVAEVSDDKALDKAERKRLQIEHAPMKSAAAALVTLCDKLANVRSLADDPPSDWPLARQAEYLDWAETVVARLPSGADPGRAAFAAQMVLSRAALAGRR